MIGEVEDIVQPKGNGAFVDAMPGNSVVVDQNVGRVTYGRGEERARALQLVSRFAAMNGMTIPEYCEYCWKVELRQGGMEENEAQERARRHVADCMKGGEQEAAFDIVRRYAMKSKLTVAGYLDFCRRNDKNEKAHTD